MSYVRNLCFVFLLITINIFLNQVCLGATLVERWDRSAIGEYVPGTLIHGDLGNWIVDATIDETGDCGPYPHKVTIEHSENGKLLRVISNPSNSHCVDNIWVDLTTKLGPPVSNNITISIEPNTKLSFEMAGALLNPKGPSRYECFIPPCYDNISIFVEDTKGNIIAYVLRRPSWASPDESKGDYREIFLDEEASFYSRNLYGDFSLLNNFDKVGSEINSIWLEVCEHGWFTVKNIMITKSDIGQFGSLVVHIEPLAAVNVGAQWRRTGTTVWHNSGYTEANIPVGMHTIEFKDISAWITPENGVVTVEEGNTTKATGTYSLKSSLTDLEQANTIFNWLESLFPEILSPISQPTHESDGIYFRYYPGTNVYIGTIQNDLYFYDHLGVLHNLGSVDTWLPYAQGIKEL